VVLRGLGHRGKSTMARVLAERAADGGREIVIADADRTMPTSPTLERFLTGVIHPGDVTEDQMHDWYGDLIDSWYRGLVDPAIKVKASLLIDTPGGDHSWPEFRQTVGLDERLSSLEVRIRVVEVLILGPDTAELNIFKETKHGVKQSKDLLIVLNEGIDSAGSAGERAFADVLKNKDFQAATKAGAPYIFLPRLRCMPHVNGDNLTFRKAQSTLGLTNSGEVSSWRKRIEERLVKVQDMLP